MSSGSDQTRKAPRILTASHRADWMIGIWSMKHRTNPSRRATHPVGRRYDGLVLRELLRGGTPRNNGIGENDRFAGLIIIRPVSPGTEKGRNQMLRLALFFLIIALI